MPYPSAAPIGVFDSGLGGLSVLKAIRNVLPREDLIYVADSGFAPYGDRDSAFIESRAVAIAEFLVGAGAKALVVACNTATVVAVRRLRSLHSLPIVAMEPAIKPAVAHSKTGVVGVLATRRTLESASVAELCRLHGEKARIILQACPGLVEQVERGETEGPATLELLEGYLTPLLAAGADTLVLGCTHYPFLESAIRTIAGPDVQVLDSSLAVARQLERRLACHAHPGGGSAAGGESFFTTGAADSASSLVARLWGFPVQVENVPGTREPRDRFAFARGSL